MSPCHPFQLKSALWALLVLPLTGKGTEDAVSFNRDIRPILSDTCFQCHGPDPQTREASLRLDREESVREDRGGYAAITPGDVEASEVIYLIFSDNPKERMPPADHHRELNLAEKNLIRRWVEEGAVYENHWAFETPVRPAVPGGTGLDEKLHPIDAFVRQRLAAAGLSPSPPADRATLLRRASIDLTGLPPTPDEVRHFRANESARAYEQELDRLLASSRYGQRMAWDWLDAARYADTNGYQGDRDRGMWPWRDWVVDAFNDNMPFDRFTIEQLAGDLLPEPTVEQRLATAFLRNHMINGEGGRIAEENRIDYLVDQTDTVSTVWLGMTMGCARCHDHKYDPVRQREYYQLMAFFNRTAITGVGTDPQTAPVLDLTTPMQRQQLEQFKERIQLAQTAVAELERQVFPRPEGEPTSASAKARDLQGGAYLDYFAQEVSQRKNGPTFQLAIYLEKSEPEYAEALLQILKAGNQQGAVKDAMPIVMVMADTVERDTFVLDNGLYDRPGDRVQPGFPAALNEGVAEFGNLNRLDLARWLMADEHPLTARVTVNRFWQSLFGAGLLEQVENFGVQSPPPLHQDLLDWLAVEFRDSGWDVKALLKSIMLSATYRQSSRVAAELGVRDPDNRLLARGPRFRMSSWMLRDQALAIGGLLDETMGGQAVNPYQPDGLWEEASFGKKKYERGQGTDLHRRSLYTFWRRILGPPVFFDAAARQVCEVKSKRTNTPLHALTTLNDVTYTEAARRYAQRILEIGPGDDDDRLADAFELATARLPERNEASLLKRALAKYRAHFAADERAARQVVSVGESPRNLALDVIEHAAWSTLCLLILNLDETLTKE